MPYVTALALTLLVEVPTYALVLALTRLTRPGRAILAAVVVNLVTHPIVWLVLTHVPAGAWWPWFVVCEAFAWLAEALLLWTWLRRDPGLLILTSLVANTASLLAGLLLLGR